MFASNLEFNNKKKKTRHRNKVEYWVGIILWYSFINRRYARNRYRFFKARVSPEQTLTWKSVSRRKENGRSRKITFSVRLKTNPTREVQDQFRNDSCSVFFTLKFPACFITSVIISQQYINRLIICLIYSLNSMHVIILVHCCSERMKQKFATETE